MSSSGGSHNVNGTFRPSNSYVHVVTKGHLSQPVAKDLKSALVLDDDCAFNSDLSLAVFGKLKEFESLSNIKKSLATEGFADVVIRYMGGYWILLQFNTITTKDKFMAHVGVNSWFSKLQHASHDFKIDERVTWIDLEGVPLCVWSHNTFVRISSKWGSLLHEEEDEETHFHRKRICIKTTLDENIFETFKIIVKGKIFDFELRKEIPETIFEQADHGDIKTTAEKGKISEDIEDGQSADPFNLYDLLKKNKHVSMKIPQTQEEPKYPPGFTPCVTSEVNSNVGTIPTRGLKEHNKNSHDMAKVSLVTKHVPNSNTKEDDAGVSNSSGHFHSVGAPKSDGSILLLMEDLINVKWKGDVIIMGDFNEVRCQEERFGSIFNSQGAAAFNNFISLGGLVELLKKETRKWVKDNNDKSKNHKYNLKQRLAEIDSLLDKGEGSTVILEERMRDENTNFFHGIINKQRNNLAIRGILVDGAWIEDPIAVKNEFLNHFRDRFNSPCSERFVLDMDFPNKLTIDQKNDLERPFTKEEIKGAIWDCGLNKSPGPDGFTFGFYRRYWNLLEYDIVEAVNHFYFHGFCPKGGNSSFIALIPKTFNAKLVKDFRPISLIGRLYKIIAKILANRLVLVMGDLVNEVQSAFIDNRNILDGPFILNEVMQWSKAKKKQTMIFKVDFEKAFDSVRWDFLVDVLKKFGFGDRWCNWIKSCLCSSRGSILVNGSPASEFQFQKVAAVDIGCMILKAPFSYFGVKIGDRMSRVKAWDEVINKLLCRLSKSKLKTLLIGGRLTLLLIVASKLSQPDLDVSFRRKPIGGAEQDQMYALRLKIKGHILSNSMDRWYWSLTCSGEFSVASIRNFIDDQSFKVFSPSTRWNKAAPKKINIMAWKVKMTNLPTRFNLSRRGLNIESILCPICNLAAETSCHLFFKCCMVKDIYKKIESWWDINMVSTSSYEEWCIWFSSLRLSSKAKLFLEGERINNYNGSKDEMSGSVCSGIFKKPVAPQSGGSILCVLEELVKVGQAMGYNMKGKQKWRNMNCGGVKVVGEIITFDYAHADSGANSGGFLHLGSNSFQKVIFLSDHRPILLVHPIHDLRAPIPFRYFTIGRYGLDGFNKFVIDHGILAPVNINALRTVMQKVKFLKGTKVGDRTFPVYSLAEIIDRSCWRDIINEVRKLKDQDKLRAKFVLGGISNIRTLTPSLNGSTGWPLYDLQSKVKND
ncbi:RNA-directed DNA polymerase, eukaryota, reverse transcriptase zinc-binding domain protein [Tanacetum coccineum]